MSGYLSAGLTNNTAFFPMNTNLQSAPQLTPAARFESFIEPLEARIAPATITVTTLNDVVDLNDHKLSLREALALADLTPATKDTIVFKLPAPVVPGVNTIKLNGTELAS